MRKMSDSISLLDQCVESYVQRVIVDKKSVEAVDKLIFKQRDGNVGLVFNAQERVFAQTRGHIQIAGHVYKDHVVIFVKIVGGQIACERCFGHRLERFVVHERVIFGYFFHVNAFEMPVGFGFNLVKQKKEA